MITGMPLAAYILASIKAYHVLLPSLIRSPNSSVFAGYLKTTLTFVLEMGKIKTFIHVIMHDARRLAASCRRHGTKL